MKRIILSVTGTVTGLIALLSFKTQTHPPAGPVALPSAAIGAQTSGPETTIPIPSSSTTAAGTPTVTPSTSAAPTSESYLGSSVTTRYGVIQVRVTVRAKKITNVSFAQLTAFDGRSQQIDSNAAPQLLQETLSLQSAKIDTVSGASYTSDGYRQSLQSALDKAGIR